MAITLQWLFLFFGRPLVSVSSQGNWRNQIYVPKINHVACLFFLLTSAVDHSLVLVRATFFSSGYVCECRFHVFCVLFFLLPCLCYLFLLSFSFPYICISRTVSAEEHIKLSGAILD